MAWLLAAISLGLPVLYAMVHAVSPASASFVAPGFLFGLVGVWGALQIQSLRLWWRAKRRLVWFPLTIFLTGMFGQFVMVVVWILLSFQLDFGSGSGSGSSGSFGFAIWSGC